MNAGTAPRHRDSIDVLIASPRRARVQGLKDALAHETDLHWVGPDCEHPIGIALHVLALRPQVLLLDAALRVAVGAPELGAWRRQFPALRVLLWCDGVDAVLVEQILAQRWSGCLAVDEPAATCARAIRAVARGEWWLPRGLLAEACARWLDLREAAAAAPSAAPSLGDGAALTPREADVVEQLRRGATNKEIARALGIMEDTVKKHLQSVFVKLGVHRRGLVMLHDPSPNGRRSHDRGMGGHRVA